MKKLSLILVVFLFIVLSENVSFSETDARVDTNHWYPETLPDGQSEYELELSVWSEDSFAITVENVNDAAIFSSEPVTLATEDNEYVYVISTLDEDGDQVSISASILPDWLTLTDTGDGTALLTGTPSNDASFSAMSWPWSETFTFLSIKRSLPSLPM